MRCEINLMNSFCASHETNGFVIRRRCKFSRMASFAVISTFILVLSPAVGGSDALAEALYDPSSDSYFELLTDDFPGGNWSKARSFAENLIYKGRRGRLAVIRTRETHEFIQKNFKFRTPVWIGLRYMCSNRKLIWVTGKQLNRDSDFQAWHRQWRRPAPSSRCGGRRKTYMPVYYTADGGPSFWQASGSAKHFNWVLLEYPAK